MLTDSYIRLTQSTHLAFYCVLFCRSRHEDKTTFGVIKNVKKNELDAPDAQRLWCQVGQLGIKVLLSLYRKKLFFLARQVKDSYLNVISYATYTYNFQ